MSIIDEHSLATATSINNNSGGGSKLNSAKSKKRRKPKYIDIMCSQMET